MKKILIAIGLLLILATGAAIFMEENARNQQTLLTNPIGDEEDIKKAAQEYEKRREETNAGALSGSWMWQSSVDASGETISPSDPERFVLTFTEDGRLSSTTDCNSIAGSYIKNEEVISVGPLISTKMACMEETLEMEYAAQLSLTTSHTIEGDTLKIILAKDAGVMTFVRN